MCVKTKRTAAWSAFVCVSRRLSFRADCISLGLDRALSAWSVVSMCVLLFRHARLVHLVSRSSVAAWGSGPIRGEVDGSRPVLGPAWPRSGRTWSSSTEAGPCSTDIVPEPIQCGGVRTGLPEFSKFGPAATRFGLIRRCWPKLAQTRPMLGEFGRPWPDLSLSSTRRAENAPSEAHRRQCRQVRVKHHCGHTP